MTAATLDARREARECVRGPGKFEGEPAIVAYLYGVTLDGFVDAEWEDGASWYGLIGRWILRSDSQGFVTGSKYASREGAMEVFDTLTAPVAHEWQESRFTGAITCARCGLLPLDDDDINTDCS